MGPSREAETGHISLALEYSPWECPGHLKGKAMNGAGNKNSLAKGVFTMDLLSVEQALSWHYVGPKTLGNIGADNKSGRH